MERKEFAKEKVMFNNYSDLFINLNVTLTENKK